MRTAVAFRCRFQSVSRSEFFHFPCIPSSPTNNRTKSLRLSPNSLAMKAQRLGSDGNTSRGRRYDALTVFRKILVLGPHVDDAELGCGGTISRLVELGAEVRCLVFSDARRSTPPGYAEGALRKEAEAAARVLNVAELEVKSYDVRRFPTERQPILEDLVVAKHEFEPDLVLLPSTSDIHQDHQVIRVEGERAFKMSTILGYEMP